MPRTKGQNKTKIAVYLDDDAALVYALLKNKSAGISAALSLLSQDEKYAFLFNKSANTNSVMANKSIDKPTATEEPTVIKTEQLGGNNIS